MRRDVGFGAKDGANGINHHASDGTDFFQQFENYHEVELIRGGVLAGVYKRDHLRINSVHYQGIERLGDGLTVEAVAGDGLIEAFSANISGSQVIGVQWHPEWQTDKYPESQVYFQMMGQALRGMPLR